MEESFSKEKGKCGQRSAGFSSAGEDMISKLPDSLISQILLCLPTKESVRTSVLSNRWKSLWRLIPVLDLASSELPDYNAFVSFIDSFLGFGREDKSCLHKLKLVIHKCENDQSCVTRWIDFVATPKLEHLHVDFGLVSRECMEVMPLSLYVCETLLHLTLNWVSLGWFKSVSLPRLKTMRLESNIYANEASLQLLISSCPVLEDLSIVRRPDDNVKVLRVHSQALTSLSMRVGGGHDDDEVYIEDFDFEDFAVLIDAPRLKYLTFDYELSPSKVISNSGSLTKVNLLGCLCLWDDLVKRKFFTSISGVKDMNISYDTFEIIKTIMPLAQFCNLSCLEAAVLPDSLGSLPRFLESFPNLKSLILDLCDCTLTLREEIRLSFVPQCLLSSLGFVELKTSCCGTPTKMEVARYFAKNAVMLKKLVLHLSMLEEKSVVLRDLLALPRRSSTCQIIVC
uniref:Putative FBD-associated F-box protein n=1 Tax=Noccaea caerulescens TaxID=107243 RepID=A0A1J3GPZ5_NOCCA